MTALLLALSLAAAPRPGPDALRALARAEVPPLPALARLRDLAAAARGGADPTVETVRRRLRAMRALEAEARTLLAEDLLPDARAGVHLALGIAWEELAELESALAIEGEGEGPLRDAVRQQAAMRADDARALGAAELFDCDRQPGVGRAMARACAEGRQLGKNLAQGAAAEVVIRSRTAEIQACYQEHLLARDGGDPLQLIATLDLEPMGKSRRVSAVHFAPQLQAGRVHLAECLTTRILGWILTDDADAVEIPMRLGTR